MRPTSLLDRRTFLAAGGAALGAAVSGCATQGPFFARTKLPIGIQLYTLAPDAAADLDGTFAGLARIGYTSIELAGFVNRTPAQMRAALDRAGLVSTSAHIQGRGADSFSSDLGKLIDSLNTIGIKKAVLPSPYVPDRLTAGGGGFRQILAGMTADDWKMNADFLNEKAAVLKRAGISVGYHNHNFEFAPVGQTTGFDILVAGTDPSLVTFEVDVGWVAAAGLDPLALIKKHRRRVTMMHVKDIKATTVPSFNGPMDPTEVGSGTVDWPTLLPAAYAQGVRDFYVEQEAPFARPRIEAAKISYDYLARVGA